MKKILGLLILSLIAAGMAFGQETRDSTRQEQPPPPPKPAKQKEPFSLSKIYVGGNMVLTVGNYTRIGAYPLIGYKFTPKLSGGIKIGYEYIRDNRWTETYESSNYGGSLFARYRIFLPLYAHVEFAGINYDIYDALGNSQREWVPFLYVGGGYSQRMGRNVWLNAQVMFDVLQDPDSPYRRWDPVFTVGVAAGF